jgi:hypothetical protein
MVSGGFTESDTTYLNASGTLTQLTRPVPPGTETAVTVNWEGTRVVVVVVVVIVPSVIAVIVFTIGSPGIYALTVYCVPGLNP